MSKSREILTLIIIQDGRKVLLGLKKRGFGQGRWNGFGGKVKEDETIEQAARRELKEECLIEVVNLERRGILEFEFLNDSKILTVHIFYSSDFVGEPVETDEMRPMWFHLDEIPFSQMWPDDVYWFPLFLRGSKFRGKFLFTDQNTISSYQLDLVDDS